MHPVIKKQDILETRNLNAIAYLALLKCLCKCCRRVRVRVCEDKVIEGLEDLEDVMGLELGK